MYGLSLSFCVSDILHGRIPLATVKGIVSSTSISTRGGMWRVISMYAQSYWQGFTYEEINEVLCYITHNGLLIQPRLLADHVQMDCSGNKWVDTLGEALAKIITHGQPLVDVHEFDPCKVW